jgi:hypothetical protein
MQSTESSADIRADKISGDLRRGDPGALRGAADQLRGVVQDDPQQALNIIQRANSESQGSPASIYINDGFVMIENNITGGFQQLGQLGAGRFSSSEQPPYVALSPDDCNRADKVSGDLRRGDDGSLRGAVTQLQGMMKDDPERAIAVINKANQESYGAPANISITGNDVQINNYGTGQTIDAGSMGVISPDGASIPSVTLTEADRERGDKVSGDLRRGDYGALLGAREQLAGMLQDDPTRAQALFKYVESESFGAPARIRRHHHRFQIVNDITGSTVSLDASSIQKGL